MIFCTDIDLLHWEPNLFKDAAFASQQLLTGTGTLAGTTFTIDSGSLIDSHIGANQVIVLSGGLEGSYPIVSVNSATALTLSVLYDGLFPDEGAGVASPAGSGVGLTFAIRSMWAQRKVVSDLLLRAAGLEPDGEGQVVNADVLKRPCVLGTLQMIYSALAAAAADPTNLDIRATLYERLYKRSLAQVRVEIDLDGDDEADVVRKLNVLELERI